MLYGHHAGGLELRRAADGAARVHGVFPYNKTAVLSDGGRNGRPRKEIIRPRAFAYRVERPDENIHLLAGHDYNRPLASREAGTLTLKDSDEALTFEAIITPEIQRASYVADLLAGIAAGLVLGLSPGFRLPPERAVKNAETIENEGTDPANGMHNAIIRSVWAALLFELSVVTVAAYLEAQVEARNWTPSGDGKAQLVSHLHRWRL
jgi:HK97 family phage prohead protease